jgi:hypothetical protein
MTELYAIRVPCFVSNVRGPIFASARADSRPLSPVPLETDAIIDKALPA